MAMGNDKFMAPGAVGRALQVPRDCFTPDALGAGYQDVLRFQHFKRVTQSVGEHAVKFDLLRRKAETCTHPGGSFPAAFASVLCLQNASLSGADKSPVAISVHGRTVLKSIFARFIQSLVD